MPRMLAAMKSRSISWPALSGQDLSDLLVYLRNLPSTRQLVPRFEITSGADGAALFRSKAAQGATTRTRRSRAASAAARSPTSPRRCGTTRPRWPRPSAPPANSSPAKCATLLSYVWARQFFEDAGDPARGRRVFVAKQLRRLPRNAAPRPSCPPPARVYNGPAMIAALVASRTRHARPHEGAAAWPGRASMRPTCPA